MSEEQKVTPKKPKIESDPRVLAYLNIPPPNNTSVANYLFTALNAIVNRMMNLEAKFSAMEKRVSETNKSNIISPYDITKAPRL